MRTVPAHIERYRREKDAYFRSAHDSPIAPAKRSAFRGLRYFPYDPKFHVNARFRRYPQPPTVTISTSTGSEQQYLRYGYYEFELDGVTHRLEAYKAPHAPEDTLFVPFRDATSGKESYGAARYLDVPAPKTEATVLDFNEAYNPFCAYTPGYVCPLAPRDNRLSIPIRAGEMNYEDSH